MSELYPIKFKPVYKEKVWGGERLNKIIGKKVNGNHIGESWELSGIAGSVSVVSNGFLTGNDLHEIIEVYMGDILGERVFEKFGNEFPLLLKFIDANQVLSVQVHPDDYMAMEKHESFGKSELWYIVDAAPDAYVYTGFNREVSKIRVAEHIKNNTIPEILNKEIAKNGDSFFIPAGRIHATGPGVLFAEIQQSSDITYRVYDWNRKGIDGKLRDLHINAALEAIDYKQPRNFRNVYENKIEQPIEIGHCSYFVVNKLIVKQSYTAEYNGIDSFVAYMCLKGDAILLCDNGTKETICMGETVLIPAVIENVRIQCQNGVELLEIYIPETENEENL